MTGAMLRQDLIILNESIRAGRDAKLSGNFDEHKRVGSARSLVPFRVAWQKACDEGGIGHARFALIFTEPQETAASRTVHIEGHDRGELRTCSRSV